MYVIVYYNAIPKMSAMLRVSSLEPRDWWSSWAICQSSWSRHTWSGTPSTTSGNMKSEPSPNAWRSVHQFYFWENMLPCWGCTVDLLNRTVEKALGLDQSDCSLGLCNAELSPQRYRCGPRSERIGRAGPIPNATYTVATKMILH